MLTFFIYSSTECSPINVINETINNMQHTLDPESKITLGNLSPERLTPNLFLGINLDNIADRNNITLEWTNYPSTSSSSNTADLHSLPPHHAGMLANPMASFTTTSGSTATPLMSMPTTSNTMLRQSLNHVSMDISNNLNLENSTSSYDEIKFLNVDHFNMDSFKSDCVLNMDQSMMLDDKTISVSSDLLGETSDDLDIHSSFSISESMDKSSPLMDLEKPVMNICSLESLQRQNLSK